MQLQIFWLKMKNQLSESSRSEDRILLIQLQKKLLMQSLVSFYQSSDSAVLFFKIK